MKLSQILTEAEGDYPANPVSETPSSGLGRSCDYCPSEAVCVIFDRRVCSQHEGTARRDWEDRRPGRLSRIASQEQNEQPEIKDDEDEDEELSANLPDIEGTTDDLVQGVIRKEGGKWCVRSEKNPDWNGGCFASKGAAEKRLKQVEFFKHKGGFFHEGEFFRAKTDGVYWFDTRQGSWLPWRMWTSDSDSHLFDADQGSWLPLRTAKDVQTGVQRNLGANHPKRAAGILFVCQGRVLLVRRAYDENNPNLWSIPGGHVKLAHDGMPQDVWGNAKREVKEEMGGLPPGIGRATRKHKAISRSGNTYVTYVVELPPGAMKWRPQLNPEHAAYRWCNRKQAKALRLHPNVKRVLKNSDIWDGKFYSTVTIHLERDAQNLGTIMQEGARQVRTINAAAEEVYGQMGKDLQYVRLELTTVIHGPPGYIPVAGVAGVLRQGSTELFFQTSISPKNGNLRVLLTTRKTGLKVAATFRSPKGIARWVTQQLANHLNS